MFWKVLFSASSLLSTGPSWMIFVSFVLLEPHPGRSMQDLTEETQREMKLKTLGQDLRGNEKVHWKEKLECSTLL